MQSKHLSQHQSAQKHLFTRHRLVQAQQRSQKAANVAKKPVKAVKQTSLFQGLADAQGRLNGSEVSWAAFLGWGLVAGVTFGSFIQISHNNPNLPVWACSLQCKHIAICVCIGAYHATHVLYSAADSQASKINVDPSRALLSLYTLSESGRVL